MTYWNIGTAVRMREMQDQQQQHRNSTLAETTFRQRTVSFEEEIPFESFRNVSENEEDQKYVDSGGTTVVQLHNQRSKSQQSLTELCNSLNQSERKGENKNRQPLLVIGRTVHNLNLPFDVDKNIVSKDICKARVSQEERTLNGTRIDEEHSAENYFTSSKRSLICRQAKAMIHNGNQDKENLKTKAPKAVTNVKVTSFSKFDNVLELGQPLRNDTDRINTPSVKSNDILETEKFNFRNKNKRILPKFPCETIEEEIILSERKVVCDSSKASNRKQRNFQSKSSTSVDDSTELDKITVIPDQSGIPEQSVTNRESHHRGSGLVTHSESSKNHPHQYNESIQTRFLLKLNSPFLEFNLYFKSQMFYSSLLGHTQKVN
jgi:hypothetical protein